MHKIHGKAAYVCCIECKQNSILISKSFFVFLQNRPRVFLDTMTLETAPAVSVPSGSFPIIGTALHAFFVEMTTAGEVLWEV